MQRRFPTSSFGRFFHLPSKTEELAFGIKEGFSRLCSRVQKRKAIRVGNSILHAIEFAFSEMSWLHNEGERVLWLYI